LSPGRINNFRGRDILDALLKTIEKVFTAVCVAMLRAQESVKLRQQIRGHVIAHEKYRLSLDTYAFLRMAQSATFSASTNLGSCGDCVFVSLDRAATTLL
jgi:hypothetical protein